MIDATCAARQKALAAALRERGLSACLVLDFEHRRDASLRYLCGQPSDALLVLDDQGHSVLIAWDINLARQMGSAQHILPYTDYGRKPQTALKAALELLGIPQGARIALPPSTPYPDYIDYVAELDAFDLVCEKSGVHEAITTMRARKDEAEIERYRHAAGLTDQLMDMVEAEVRAGRLATETDVALFLEREARLRGAEGMGFETLAAGPTRSFGIHAFPTFTAGPFGSQGFSILDFGINFEGYTTDVTMTFVRGELSSTQQKMLALVREAYDRALAACAPGARILEVASAVDELFKAEGWFMPHSLGHGIGLEAHEAPLVSMRADSEARLEPGHIITLEPGLYHPEFGGVRLENDVLITAAGAEVLTHSRIVYL